MFAADTAVIIKTESAEDEALRGRTGKVSSHVPGYTFVELDKPLADGRKLVKVLPDSLQKAHGRFRPWLIPVAVRAYK